MSLTAQKHEELSRQAHMMPTEDCWCEAEARIDQALALFSNGPSHGNALRLSELLREAEIYLNELRGEAA